MLLDIVGNLLKFHRWINYQLGPGLMIARMGLLSIIAACAVTTTDGNPWVIFLTLILVFLYCIYELKIEVHSYWRTRYWYGGIDAMQFYFEGHDNRLVWFMDEMQTRYPDMYNLFIDEKYYINNSITYELCKYLIARVHRLSDCCSSHTHKLFIAACYKDASQGSQPDDPKINILTHVILAFHEDDTQYEEPIIIDPFYRKYMPEIVNWREDNVFNIKVITDREESESVYMIKKIYDLIGCTTIPTKRIGRNSVEVYQAPDHVEAIPYTEWFSALTPGYSSLDEVTED